MRISSFQNSKFALRFAAPLALSLALAGFSLSVPAFAQNHNSPASPAPAINQINAPGAGTSSCGGTTPTSINSSGVITGWFQDASCVFHGFIESPSGTFISFDVPAAGINPDQGTTPTSINDSGAITGYYNDEMGIHGFVRTPDGKVATFDVPGATDQFDNSTTQPAWISSTGAVAGSYRDSNQTSHSFLRSPEGVIFTIDPPPPHTQFDNGGSGAVFASPNGAVIGWNGFNGDSYLRSPDGAFTAISAPDAGTAVDPGTFARGMDSSGVIAGSFTDPLGMEHGFLRTPGGSFTTFDIPGQGAQSGEGPDVVAINVNGAVAGTYAIDSGAPGSNPVIQGFVRQPDGTIQTFTAPGANTGYCGAGTRVVGMNSAGAIVGWFTDANCVAHGFFRAAPDPPKRRPRRDNRNSRGSER